MPCRRSPGWEYDRARFGENAREAVQDNASKAYLARVEKSFRRDYEGDLPASLVIPSSDATWLEQDKTPNPARIGPLLAQCITSGQATAIRRSAVRAMTGDLAISSTLRPGRSIGTTTSMPNRPNSSSSRTQSFSKRLACMKERVSASSPMPITCPSKRTSEVVGACSHEYNISRQP
jgi:hypothetical protein